MSQEPILAEYIYIYIYIHRQYSIRGIELRKNTCTQTSMDPHIWMETVYYKAHSRNTCICKMYMSSCLSCLCLSLADVTSAGTSVSRCLLLASCRISSSPSHGHESF